VLIEAARLGNEKEVAEYSDVFTEHANKLVEVGSIKEMVANIHINYLHLPRLQIWLAA
jgi:hypothetical protein